MAVVVATDLRGKNVLVTGGSGFIGQHLVSSLLNKGANVAILSRHGLITPDTEKLRFNVVNGDLTQPATLAGICRGVNIVFHLAGHSHALDQADNKSEGVNQCVTVNGTRALLELSLRDGVERFIFFSSVKAMGEGGDACLDETAESKPVTSYGRAKLEAEMLVLEAVRRGMSSTVFRLPMVYGPRCKGNLPRMIQAVACGRFPPLPETGNRRSMVDVRDVLQAAMLAATNPIATGKIYIVTENQAYSTRQIYEWICSALGRPVPRWTVPLAWLRVVARAGDVFGRLAGRRFILDTESLNKLIGSAWYSSEKIGHELGYRPVHTLQDALPEMVAEFRMNS